VLETITQDEVDGQVDKLFVLYDYTFVSFVPLTLNQRPTFGELELDYDGLAIYDKKDYFSSSTRQSFVVDNGSGLIYKIENINIDNISKGIIWLKNNFVPHDIRIKTNGDLEFYPFFTNTSIIAFDAFKDKYGNKFILNNRINLVDTSSKTTFFVHQYKSNPHPNSQLKKVLDNQAFTEVQKNITGFSKTTSYWLTDSNETLMVEVSEDFWTNPSTSTNWLNWLIRDLKLVDNNHARTTLPTNMNSKVFDFDTLFGGRQNFLLPQEINNGWVYFESLSSEGYLNGWEKNDKLLSQGYIAAYNIHSRLEVSMYLYSPGKPTWNISNFKNNDIIIEYRDGKIYIINRFKDYLKKLYSLPVFSGYNSKISLSDSIIEFATNLQNLSEVQLSSQNISLDYEMLLENVGIENGEIIRFGVDGNITYELILEQVNGELKLVPYVKGTYVAPPPSTITFQPINR
jgi:hypothetical protein